MALPSLTPGRYAFHTIATDYIGNAGSSSTVDFTIDNSAPQVAITSPNNGVAYASLPSVTGTTADTSGISSVRVRLFHAGTGTYWNGTAWVSAPTEAAAQGTTAWNLRLPALPNGKFVAFAIARDSAGNETVSSFITFTVDTTAPAITVTSPVAKVFYGKTPTARGTAIDTGLGTKTVTLLLYRYANGPTPAGYWQGGNSWGSTYNATLQERTTLGGKNWALNLPDLSTGTYYVRATAIDVAGNYRRSAPVVFTVDRTAPSVAVTTPSTGTKAAALGLATGTASDIGSGVLRVSVVLYRYANGTASAGYWAGGNTWTPQYTARSSERLATGTSHWNITLPPLTAGRYWLRATAYDHAGYFTRSLLSLFTIATAPPVTRATEATSTEATSTEATVGAAVVSPIVLSSANINAGALSLQWAGPLDAPSANNVAHYRVTVDGRAVEISGVTQAADGQHVTLLLNEGILQRGDSLEVAWSGLEDQQSRNVKDGTTHLVVP